MGHHDRDLFAIEKCPSIEFRPDFLTVDVAVDPMQWSECSDLVGGFDRSEVACVPNLIDLFEKVPKRLVEDPVCIRKYADAFQN